MTEYPEETAARAEATATGRPVAWSRVVCKGLTPEQIADRDAFCAKHGIEHDGWDGSVSIGGIVWSA